MGKVQGSSRISGTRRKAWEKATVTERGNDDKTHPAVKVRDPRS